MFPDQAKRPAAQIAALDTLLHDWDVAGLVALALAETDFLADLDPATLADNAANSADLAADITEDRTGIAVPHALISDARQALAERGYTILAAREQAEIDARRDGQEAGDLDAAGEPIPYPNYRSV